MRVLLLLTVAALVLTLVAAVPSVSDANSLDFQAWKLEHGKIYSSPAEEERRLAIFEANLAAIAQDDRLALNQFADMSPEEFRSKMLMPRRKAPVHSPDRVLPDVMIQDLPPAFDWRDQGAVTAVKDQGTVGSCWSFSTTGNIEGQWFLANNSLVALSEEQIIECDGSFDVKQQHADCGVFGGWPYLALQYVIKAGGVEPETSYPYCVGDGSCYPCMAPGWNQTLCGQPPEYCNKTKWHCHQEKSADAASISDWAAISTDEKQIQARLVSQGPLSVLLDATGLQFYHHGVWDSKICSSSDLDHAVLLVGYGTEKSLFGTKDYWIVKNSWAKKWGEDGYFRIARGKGECGINTAVVTALV